MIDKYYLCSCQIIDSRLQPVPPTPSLPFLAEHRKQQQCNRSSSAYVLLRYRYLSSCLAQQQLKPSSRQFCRLLTRWQSGTHISQVVYFFSSLESFIDCPSSMVAR